MDNEDRYRWAADYVDANREGSDTKPRRILNLHPIPRSRRSPTCDCR